MILVGGRHNVERKVANQGTLSSGIGMKGIGWSTAAHVLDNALQCVGSEVGPNGALAIRQYHPHTMFIVTASVGPPVPAAAYYLHHTRRAAGGSI